MVKATQVCAAAKTKENPEMPILPSLKRDLGQFPLAAWPFQGRLLNGSRKEFES